MAGNKDRQRRLARERYERQQVRRVERARKLRQRAIVGSSAFAVVAIAVGAYFLFGTGSGKSAASATSKPSATPSATPTVSIPPATPLATVPTTPPTVAPASHCTYTSSGAAARKVGTPPATPDSKATYQATIVTNRGTVVMDLLNSRAPCTVNSFVYLAKKAYFNSTPCHRLTTSGIYVLQCGDPTGTGSGGPGYKFANENTTGATYPAGTVAMANAGAGTNGSQFFLVYAGGGLSPNYTPFGVVVKGLDIVRKVAEAGSNNSNGAGDGKPNEAVTIESVKITT